MSTDAAGPRGRLDGVRLLLVEDYPLNQMVAKGMLEQYGAVVDTADDGLIALELLRTAARPYDAILMDVQMPVMDGVSAARAIRADLGLSTPILAISAGGTPSERALCDAAGMNDFLAKPLDGSQMLTALLRQLSAAALAPAAPRVHLNLDHLLLVAEGDPAFLARVLNLIGDAIARAPTEFAAARAAWQEGRWEAAAAMLHGMRGSIGVLGAEGFGKLTLELEHLVRGAPDDVRSLVLFDTVEQELTATMLAAQRWIACQRAPVVSGAPPR